MTAGRELDTLVAEKVMGLELCTCTQDEVVAWKIGLNITGLAHFSSLGQCSRTGKWQLKPYSTSIKAAWQVVEKMRERCFGFSLNDGWIAWFIAAPNEYQSDAETAPHAICLAALKAVGAYTGSAYGS